MLSEPRWTERGERGRSASWLPAHLESKGQELGRGTRRLVRATQLTWGEAQIADSVVEERAKGSLPRRGYKTGRCTARRARLSPPHPMWMRLRVSCRSVGRAVKPGLWGAEAEAGNAAERDSCPYIYGILSRSRGKFKPLAWISP